MYVYLKECVLEFLFLKPDCIPKSSQPKIVKEQQQPNASYGLSLQLCYPKKPKKLNICYNQLNSIIFSCVARTAKYFYLLKFFNIKLTLLVACTYVLVCTIVCSMSDVERGVQFLLCLVFVICKAFTVIVCHT